LDRAGICGDWDQIWNSFDNRKKTFIGIIPAAANAVGYV